tara:strand:+ start:7614 stop:7847 length:234 start_codon:yes stop_codon:yes gene_type:complete
MATVKKDKENIADSITYLAEQLRTEETFDRNITQVFESISSNIYNSFRNDFDANVVDGLYAISESIDKLVKAIEESK